jgi:GntR family transcriptional regulator
VASKAATTATKSSKGRQRAHEPFKAKLGQPLYVQLAQILKDEIIRGVFPVGSQLPTEEDLCKRFRVSRHTVREAVRQLRDESLVISRKRAGTTVVPPRSSDSYIPDVSSINGLLAFAADGRVGIQSIKMVEIDEKLASRTGLNQGEECLAVSALVYRKGNALPICWAEYYIARNFAAVGRLLEHHTGPIFPLIEKYFGVRVLEVEQRVTACLMPAALAATLKVKAGTAAMNVRHSFRLTTGEIAEVAIGTHPASRFHHSMTMRRAKEKG